MTRLDYDVMAKKAAGNWRKFQSFGWHEQPANPEQWCIVYTHNRDSGLLDQSNAEAIEKALEPFLNAEPPADCQDVDNWEPDIYREHHGHWACGWVDGYAIRVYGPDGTVSEAFKTWCDLQESMSDYPVLDEEDYSRREYEAALEAIHEQGRRFARDDAPEGWEGEVFSWLWENNQRELENRDDQGAYPSEESVKEALEALGMAEEEED